ncbi:MAG TPA: tRNA (adenosine(37)-N6)-threonylcarbamoyltransferase complex dimerization subunit type 1 TsaB [Steroidobacteraceae bacterium]|nr:tRNA (adenosine(37)-N6)-threonylcarbamoyltransferase complex dimerization subunit type 1 TsaB [Steroidobacteraceae bacterium]
MKVLAIDTATEACSAAVLDGARLFARELELGRGHSERILALVDEVLEMAGLTLESLDGIAFGRGPGSFTGVRLAASITQGLAFAARRPVVGVSDLRALAQRVLGHSASVASVLVCNDARMHEVYWGCYRRGVDGLAEAACAEAVDVPLAVQLPPQLPRPVHGVGRGFRAYPQLGARLAGALAGIDSELLPRASEVARLAAAELAAGHGVAAELAVPEYLRDDVARPPSRD